MLKFNLTSIVFIQPKPITSAIISFLLQQAKVVTMLKYLNAGTVSSFLVVIYLAFTVKKVSST